MDTVFFSLDGLRLTDPRTQDPMGIVSKTMNGQLLSTATAANEDRLDQAGPAERAAESSGAWDAYDVWRRYIKEARERRKPHTDSN